MGWIDESSPDREITALAVEEDVVGPSTIPKASRRPKKELIGMDNSVERRAETPSDQMDNGTDGRILEDMLSVGIHQALEACLAWGTLLECTLFNRLERSLECQVGLAKDKSPKEEATKRITILETELAHK
uniref:Uncharacterized protein n=1 Tax=Asparagus officinalis TaxID=4686 RepID=Q2AA03_ASPOF|nr:hypothetical protein 20.t00004 [Asparagus officinalis]